MLVKTTKTLIWSVVTLKTVTPNGPAIWPSGFCVAPGPTLAHTKFAKPETPLQPCFVPGLSAKRGIKSIWMMFGCLLLSSCIRVKYVTKRL